MVSSVVERYISRGRRFKSCTYLFFLFIFFRKEFIDMASLTRTIKRGMIFGKMNKQQKKAYKAEKKQDK